MNSPLDEDHIVSDTERAAVRSIAKEGGWAGILNLVGAGIRYVNQIILTRFLGAKSYGLFALANTVVAVVAVPAGLGLPTALVHFLAGDVETGRWGHFRWVLRAAFRATLLSSVAGAGLVLAMGPWMAGTIFRKPGLAWPIMGLSAALPLLALYGLCAGALQGLKRIREKVFLERIGPPLVFSVLLLIGGFTFRNIHYVIACFFAAAAVVSVTGALWLRRRLAALPLKGVAPEPRWHELLSFSVPVLFFNQLTYFVLYSDVIVMGIFRNAAEVGIYNISARLAQAVSMPTDALGASLAPSFSGLMSRGDLAGLRRLFHTSTRWIFLLGSLAGLALLFGGLLVLHVFGRDFQAGYLTLCVLSVGQMFSACLGANGTLITMTGHPKVNLANSLVLGLGNLGLGLLLVPRFGAPGAAAAAATSLIIVNGARAVEIWVILKIGPWDRTILKPLLALLAGAASGVTATLLLHPLAGTAASLGAFLVIWYILGPEPEDWDMLKRAWAKLRKRPMGVGGGY